MPLDAPVTIARLPSRAATGPRLNGRVTTNRRLARLSSRAMDPPTTGRSTRLALVALGLLALLGVVAFASRSGLGHQSQARPSAGYLNYAFTAFLIVFVLAI